MLVRGTLDPENRSLYGENLRAPPGYVFDAAVATTFSLDFTTALSIPVSLALFAAENRDQILANPFALLEGAERIAGRVVIFSDACHLQAQSHASSRLCSLLEKIIVEVKAPGGGAFHPKMWVLRFKPEQENDLIKLRLLVLSRNLTQDRSWDISLSLDADVSKRPHSINRPIVELFEQLPKLATREVSQDAVDLTRSLAQDVRLAEWEIPASFEAVSFAVNGLGGKQWKPTPCSKLGVISPFCDEASLNFLAELPSDEKPAFIGRSDELAAIPNATLNRFERVSVLDDVATTEDGEEIAADTLQGLHAKLFVSESGWDTTIVVGSGNATQPALQTGKNVEIFAALTGKRSQVGTVNRILGPEGFGRLTREYAAGEIQTVDPAVRIAERQIAEAKKALCNGSLRLICRRPDHVADAAAVWQMQLVASEPLSLAGIGSLSLWPITRGEAHQRDALSSLRGMHAIDFGEMPLADLTRFVACRLSDVDEKASALFSIGLTIDGLPAERNAAILRWIIDSPSAFFRYIRLLLSELGDPLGAAFAAQNGTGPSAWGSSSDDAPILEEMVLAFCRGGDQLRAIESLMSKLELSSGEMPDPVPAEFRDVWQAFREAIDSGVPHDS